MPVAGRTTSLRAVTTTPSRVLSVVVAYKLGKAAIELLAVVAVLVLHAALGRTRARSPPASSATGCTGFGAVLADLVRLVAAPATRA